MKRLPDAYVVGAPKCATTSLYHYLAEHPAIACPLPKENHFLMHALWPGDDPYPDLEEVHAAVAGVPQDQVVVDVGVMPLYHAGCIERLKRWRPDAKVIIMVRDPVDLLYSLHSQALKEGHPVDPDFATALRQPPPPRPDRPGLVPGRDAARLERAVTAWRAAFADQVLVVHFDDLRADLQGTYDRITGFLGVPRHVLQDAKVHNPDARIRSGPVDGFLRSPPRGLQRAWHRLMPSQAVRDRIGNALLRANRRGHERPPMDPGLRARLEQEYADDVAFVRLLRAQP